LITVCPQVFTPRYSCSEIHPGLCKHDDHAIYSQALELATLLEKVFTSARLRRFYTFGRGAEIRMPRTSLETSPVVQFLHKRARKPHAQVTRVFVRCTLLAGNERPDFTYALTEPCKYHYLTVWHLAKLIIQSYGLLDEDETYVFQELHCESKVVEGTFDLLQKDEPHPLVKPPPVPRRSADHLDAAEPARTCFETA